jgi:hypothetical protein
MIPMHPNLSPDALAAAILVGDMPASAAMGRADAYDALNRGTNAPLPFLGTSTKIEASNGAGILTKVLYMQAANASGREACAYRSDGCSAACLVEYTGRMSMDAARTARRRRHASFYADRARFLADLAAEIAAHERSAARQGKPCAVRLNGTTDLPWEKMRVVYNGETFPNLMAAFPAVQFYDYTKAPLSKRGRGGILPANYHLTFSLSERSDAEERAGEYLDAGYPVAVVFAASKGNLPTMYALAGKVRFVTDADKTDARFTDAPGTIAGLSAKGRAKTDDSGFVRAA